MTTGGLIVVDEDMRRDILDLDEIKRWDCVINFNIVDYYPIYTRYNVEYCYKKQSTLVSKNERSRHHLKSMENYKKISVNSQIKNFPQQQKKKHQEFILARTIPIHTYLSQPTKHVRRTQTNPTLPILTCSLHNIHRNVSSNTSSFITFLISSCVIFNFFKSDLHEINIFLLSKQNI